ncbi:hypothetical protein BHM03_00050382 [Ensete ventricosum]|nr:hypothetical protein BHM03_00050382 [Ensete ventricosum]
MGLDAIRGRQEFLPLYLEENLGSLRVEGCCRGSRPAEVRPLYPPPRRLRGRPPGLFCSWVLLLLAFFDNQGLNRDEMSEQPEVGRYRLVSYLESEGDIADWSACRIQPATLPAACWQGCHRLVDPLHLLCPTIGQLPARVLPCYQSSIVNVIERPLELVRTSTLVVGFAETRLTSVVHLT